MSDLYPYPKDEHEHEFAFVFYNTAGLGLNFDACNLLAKHVFDDLKCGVPGTTGEPEVHYDALGTQGGPWRQGEWKPISEPRYVEPMPVAVDVTALSADQLEILKAQIAEAESKRHSDEGREG